MLDGALISTLHLWKDTGIVPSGDFAAARRLPWIWSRIYWWQRSIDTIMEAVAYDPEHQVPARSYNWLDNPKKVLDQLRERQKAILKRREDDW